MFHKTRQKAIVHKINGKSLLTASSLALIAGTVKSRLGTGTEFRWCFFFKDFRISIYFQVKLKNNHKTTYFAMSVAKTPSHFIAGTARLWFSKAWF